MQQPTRGVRATAGAFVVPLNSLCDERAATIAAFEDAEVWVTLGDTAHGERPSVLLSLGDPGQEGTPSVDAIAILRLVGDHGDRRANFLREFGRQLDFRRAVSVADETAVGLPKDAPTLRWQAAWTFDILDVDTDPTVLDVATHLCGGRGGLLLLLLRKALELLQSSSETLKLRTLLDASAAGDLQDQVRERFVRSLDDATARAIFGATAILAETPAAAVPAAEVADALNAFWSADIGVDRVAAALNHLADDDLVRRTNEGRFAIASGLAATSTLSNAGDLEGFVSKALSESQGAGST